MSADVPRSRVVALGAGRPTVEVLEAGMGAPLVFLHGAGGIPVWEGALPQLARAFHVYAPKKRLKEPAKVKRPDAWYNMMAFWPEDSDWYAAKLPMRSY